MGVEGAGSRFTPQFLCVKDGVLYVDGVSNNYSHSLRSYVPDGSGLKQTGKVLLDTHANDSSPRYSVGGMFAGK